METAPALIFEVIAEISSLQQNMKTVKKAVGDMSNSVSRNTRAVNDNFRSMGDGATHVSTKMLQAAKVSQDVATRINATTGVMRDGYQRTAKDVEDFGQKLDRLRAKYNPQFSVIQRYQNELMEMRRAHKVGAISADELAAAQSRLRQSTLGTLKGMRDYTGAGTGVVNSAGAQRAGMQQLSYQIGDVATQFSLGARPMQIFAAQASQVVGAIGLMTKSSKGFIGFLGGPWGQITIGAITVLGTLASAYFGAKEGADAAGKANETLADRLDMSKNSYDAVIAATREYNDEQRRAGETALQAAEAASIEARENLKAAKAKLENARATSRLIAATSPTSSNSGRDIVNSADIRARELESDIRAMEVLIGETAFNYANELAKIKSDPIAKITEEYARQREELRGTTNDTKALAKAMADLYRQEEAAKDRIREAERAANRKPTASANRQFGREINSSSARSIAEAAGFRVTSQDRTRAEQQWLYDNRRTPQNPVALPGTSAHEKGNALDIGFGRGVTPASIRKAFEAEGVKLTKLLKETGHFHIEWSTSGVDKAMAEAEAAKKEMEKLERFGDAAGESILRINERFDDQPRLVDQTSAATRQLDKIIAELSAKMAELPEEHPLRDVFKDMQHDAEEAKYVVEDALLRPFRDLEESAMRRVQIGDLLASGREAEAQTLETIWRYEEQNTDLTNEQKDAIREIVDWENARIRAQERQRDLLDAQVGIARGLKGDLTDLLSGRKVDLLGNLKQGIADLQGARLFDRIFGDAFEQMEAQLSNSPIAKANRDYATAVDKTVTQSDILQSELGELAQTVSAANTAIRSGMTFDEAFAPFAANDNTITVTGEREKPTRIAELSIAQIADKSAAAIVRPLLMGFEDVLGTKFMMGLSEVMEGALSGYIRGGVPGGILGGARGLVFGSGPDLFGKELTEKLLGGFDKALGGAQTGTFTAGIGKALGLNMSTTGSQIGGAIGSFIPIPGGEILGSIAGGLLGGLFKKKPYGTAVLNGLDGMSVRGRGDGSEAGASSLGGAVQDSLATILDALDAELGSFAVSIGTYKDRFRVSTRGSSGKLGGYKGSAAQNEARYGLYDFATEGEAIAFAIADAIKDGAIKGLSAAEKRLLNNSDVEKAVQDILDFRSVFDRLKQKKDPVQYELDKLNDEFDRLKSLFDRAGASVAEYAQLEELYALERKDILQQTNEDLLVSMRGLLNDLTVNNPALSLRTRQDTALAEYNELKSRVQSGDTSAYDDFADIARTLLEIERQIYGSTKGYYDRLTEVTDIARSRVEGESNVQMLPVPQAETRSPFDDAPAITNAVERQTGELSSHIAALNENTIRNGQVLERIAAATSGGSRAPVLHYAETIRNV